MRKTLDNFVIELMEYMNGEYGEWDAEAYYLPLLQFITSGKASREFKANLPVKKVATIARMLVEYGDDAVNRIVRYVDCTSA